MQWIFEASLLQTVLEALQALEPFLQAGMERVA
jgi:hypothetical protein